MISLNTSIAAMKQIVEWTQVTTPSIAKKAKEALDALHQMEGVVSSEYISEFIAGVEFRVHDSHSWSPIGAVSDLLAVLKNPEAQFRMMERRVFSAPELPPEVKLELALNRKRGAELANIRVDLEFLKQENARLEDVVKEKNDWQQKFESEYRKHQVTEQERINLETLLSVYKKTSIFAPAAEEYDEYGDPVKSKLHKKMEKIMINEFLPYNRVDTMILGNIENCCIKITSMLEKEN
jgi:hypothetical protein